MAAPTVEQTTQTAQLSLPHSKTMEESEDDFGYHPVGSNHVTLDEDRRRREAGTIGAQLRNNLPMTLATGSVCAVLSYGLYKSLLSKDDHTKQSKSQAKWMGLRVMTQGAAFVTLFGFAIYSGRLFTQQSHPLRDFEKDNAQKLKV